MAAPGGQDVTVLTGNPGMSLIVPGSACSSRSFEYFLRRSFPGDVRAV